jgi:hypothetical protein
VYDESAYLDELCLKFAAPPQHRLFLRFQTHRGEFGSGSGTRKVLTEAKNAPEGGDFARMAEIRHCARSAKAPPFARAIAQGDGLSKLTVLPN